MNAWNVTFKETYNRCCIIQFNVDRRKINTCTVVAEIAKVAGDKPKIDTTATCDNFLVTVAYNKQGQNFEHECEGG